jgi:simple sugar transport system ATP-binding protein
MAGTEPRPEVILEIRGMSKRFGKVQALDNVSLAFEKGEIHTLLGENGAGKTTLMNIIYGLYQADVGEILVYGQKEDIRTPKDSLRLGIGMVPQTFKLVPDLTLFENVLLFTPEDKGFLINKRRIKAQITELSKMFSFRLEDKLDAEAGSLSEGEKQKLEIIKVLARGSKILLFDEATNVLAHHEFDAFLDVIKDMNRKGWTILYITHRLKEALQISNRISVLRKGELAGTVTGQEATFDMLTTMMVGAEIERKTAGRERKKGKPLMQVRDLNVTDERGLHAVRDVSFDLYEGEIIGLAGIDGNGSHELAEALMGLTPLRGGQILYQDQDITETPPGKRMAKGISFIPGSNVLVPLFTIRDNSILDYPEKEPFSRRGILNWRSITEHASRIVETYQVQTPSILLPSFKLSGGNKQRLALGRKIEAHPRLMIAYHPTKGLDVKSQNFIYERFLELREKGLTILFIGTDLDEILLLSDRLMVIHRGEIVGSFDDVTNVSKLDIGVLMTGGQRYTA